MPHSTNIRKLLIVRGIVQGVGFRPYVYGLAVDCGLAGTVLNNGSGVEIDVQGSRVDEFVRRLTAEAPPLVMITEVEVKDLPQHEVESFTILRSDPTSVTTALIPPDIATCDACLTELLHPGDRRYRYPFTNCTNCGPRYTITETIPYDRANTSMKDFPLCHECAQEYHDPTDRRFHAQPNACPVCGPSLWFVAGEDERDTVDFIRPMGPIGPIGHENVQSLAQESTAIAVATQALRAGRIVAIRGIGGYHLAVDACNDDAVQRLRNRKRRFEKPLAIMVRDLKRAQQYCTISPEEAALLLSPMHPIVLLKKRLRHDPSDLSDPSDQSSQLAPAVAPASPTLGVMLPYAPLHHLLFEQGFPALVMTSANLSEEPICIAPQEAEQRLHGIADDFVHHNRDILQRCDDSVFTVMHGQPRPLRRARGFVPRPILLGADGPSILAIGAELKNTVCLTKGRAAFLSQHIGDLENLETLSFFEEAAQHLMNIFEIAPVVLAHDMHPDYVGTRWACDPPQGRLAEMLRDLPRIPVQHHHAHLVSCLAENNTDRPAIGIILDGTGFGLDGTSWGGEFLVGNSQGFARAAHFATKRMPGGTAAIRQPWRMAFSYLYDVFGDSVEKEFPEFVQRRTAQEIEAAKFSLTSGSNAPVTSSCGRFFDAAASLIGLRDTVSYEAQAAIALEHLAGTAEAEPFDFAFEDNIAGTGSLTTTGFQISFDTAIRQLVNHIRRGEAASLLAARIHRTVIEACAQAAERISSESGVRTIALSGGVFQNLLIFEGLHRRLLDAGFTVHTHRQVPANDGGISLGQAVVAMKRVQSERR